MNCMRFLNAKSPNKAYFERFQVELPEIRPAIVSVNTSIIGRRPEIDLSVLIDPRERRKTLKDAQTGKRPVWFETGQVQTPIYWRDHLPIDAIIEGPAIVEQLDTTTVIDPDHRALNDTHGNLLVEVPQ